MTPDECRKEVELLRELSNVERLKMPDHCMVVAATCQAKALWEIAAQIAELNSNLQPSFPALRQKFTVPEGKALCMRIDHMHTLQAGCWVPRDKDDREREANEHWPKFNER